MIMKHRPGLSIYKSKHEALYVIVNSAVRPQYGGRVDWGPMVHIALEQMREHGTDLVLDNLRGFDERDGSQGGGLQGLSCEQQSHFDREHILVGVRQESLSQLILTPMHPAKPGGFRGTQAEQIVVDLPCLPEDFFSKLNAAFEKAG
jgi:hypothetical protein